jgi:CheY-like chemotaxis protein
MKAMPRELLSSLRVLVVDDDAEVRLIMRWMLEARGAVVSEARGGCDALDLVRNQRFDVVLTDLGLPDMPGEEVIDAIRASPETRTPVAVVSGEHPATLWRAVELGAERTFPKPVNWDDLMLYLASKRPTGSGDHRVSPTAEGKMNVLVIEDDSEMRALLCDALEAAGYRAVARPDGRELASLAALERFAAAIVDKEVPGPNGLELLSFLRERLPTVPVILVTAFGGPAIAAEAASRGAYSYLEKPFRMTAILAALAGATAAERQGRRSLPAIGE